jgi:hypothetical protein
MSKLYLKEGFVDIESILIMKMLASDNHIPLNQKRHFILNKIRYTINKIWIFTF